MNLAKELISMYHDAGAAEKAEARFKLVYSQGDIPQDIPELQMPRKSGCLNSCRKTIWSVPAVMDAAC